VNVFLVIVAVVLAVVILVVSGLLIVNFSHPDDRNVAIFPKLVTLLGLFLASATVLLLPFDVANTRGSGGGIRMDIVWQVVFILDAIFLLLLLPFAFFYYESDEDPETSARSDVGNRKIFVGQCGNAFKMTCGLIVIFLLFLIIMYLFINEAQIPVVRIAQDVSNPAQNWLNSTQSLMNPCTDPARLCNQNTFIWSIPLSFPLYVIAVLSFLGWFLFSILVGMGLVALPIDLINEYRTRPIPISRNEYLEKKLALGRRAQGLLEIAREFEVELKKPGHRNDRKTKRIDRQTQLRLEAASYVLNNQYKAVNQAFIDRGGNPIWYWFKLFLGFLSGIISLTWFLHIMIFVLPARPPSTFLNAMFIELESFIPGFPILGVLAFGLYSFYLLWCVVKGLFRIGLRFPFLFKLYPMELNNTLMNAFLFNTWVILLCSIPCLQFCATAFPVYARLTQVDVIFGSQIRYLQFFKYFFNYDVFIIMILIFSFFGFILMYMFPQDKALLMDKKMEAIAAGKFDDDDD